MMLPWRDPATGGRRDGLTWTELLVVLVVFAVIVVIAISTQISS
jgi:prepilin-type N-terminal cleavage/methylation domain-containing protein